MSKLKSGLIQMSLKGSTEDTPEKIRDAMLEAHLPLIDKAGAEGVQVLCFQEVFTQPYFCQVRMPSGMPLRNRSQTGIRSL